MRPANAILAVWPDLVSGGRSARLRVSHSGEELGQLAAEIRRVDRDEVLWQGATASTANASVELIATGIDIEPWSPDSPSLYDVWLRLECDKTVDERSARVGFRRIESTPEALTLNGAPLYIRGAFDAEPDVAVGRIEDRLRTLKAKGFNLIRCGGGVPSTAYLDAADRLGLLVWWELPAWEAPGASGTSVAAAVANTEAMLRESAVHHAHHPSLAIRSLAQTVQSLDLAASTDGRAALRSLMATARAVDPTRLVVDTAVSQDRAHVDTDLVDVHVRPFPPAKSEAFAREVAAIAGRPPWLWSRADASLPGDRPVVASVQKADSMHESHESTWAARFEQSPLRAAFASQGELRAAIRQLADLRTKQRLDDLRAAKDLAGYVVDSDSHADIRVVVAGLPSSAWTGELLSARVLRAAGADLRGRLEVTWSLNGQVCQTAQTTADDGIDPIVLDDVRVSAPSVEHIKRHTLRVTVGDGIETSEAAAEVVIVPESLRVLGNKLRVFVTGLSAPDQIGTLANAVAELGCTVLTAPTRIKAVVAVGGGPDALAQVQAGMPGLVLAEAHDTEFLPSRPRQGSSGDHIVDWLRPDAVPGFALGPILGPEFAPIAARRVMPALDGLDPADALMGTFRGALHNEAALTAQARYGEGKAVVTTLRLAEAGRSDPLGRALLVVLLRYVTSDECDPRTRVEAPNIQRGVSEGT